MKLTSQEKREIYQAMSKEGFQREAIQKFFATAPEEVLKGALGNIRSGKSVLSSIKPDSTPIKSLDRVKSQAKQEANTYLVDHPAKEPSPSDEKAKMVLYSFKVGANDLEALKALSLREGESVALLIRHAIRSYLSSKGLRH